MNALVPQLVALGLLIGGLALLVGLIGLYNRIFRNG